MSSRFGLYGLQGFRRTAWVGPKELLDVVDDIKKYGRVEFLKESVIDIHKGRAADAHLQMPRRFGDGTQDGPTGDLPAGGIRGRRGYTGVGSKPREIKVGLTQNLVTAPNIRNQY